MPTLSTQTVHFANGNTAQCYRSSNAASIPQIVHALALPAPSALLILNGGTAKLEDASLAHLQRTLQDGLARVVTEEGITMITGGTDAGIFALFGQGRARWPSSAPCIGVAVADLVTWPGKTAGEAPLEPHHSHFVLTGGQNWGDETATLYGLAAALSQECPSVALFAGGGEITIREMRANVVQGRPMILLAGSGRATDGVLAARAGERVTDERLTEIGRFAQITGFDIAKQPYMLRRLVRRILFGSKTTEK